MAEESITGGTLPQINERIGETESQWRKMMNSSSYFKLLENVFNNAYTQNKDIINQRRILREALYGDRGFKPKGFELLTPQQQQDVRLGNRAGITAGLQALNETESARGTKITDIMTDVRGEVQDRRTMLQNDLARLDSRRSALETEQNSLKRDNRQWAMNAMVQYPQLAQTLNEEDMKNINEGNLTPEVMAKINQAAAAWATRPTGGGGRPSAAQQLQGDIDSLAGQGYIAQMRDDGGVDFFAPAPENMSVANEMNINGQRVVPVSGAEWQNAARNLGYDVTFSGVRDTLGGVNTDLAESNFTNLNGSIQSALGEIETAKAESNQAAADKYDEIKQGINQDVVDGVLSQEQANYILTNLKFTL